MKAYSLDFRQKIIETYENEPISQRHLAQHFRVAPSFVTKLLKQYRETGDLAPKTRPGRPKTLKAEQVQAVQALVEAKNDITLGELCEALHHQLAVTVSEPTLCRVLQRLQLTRKKKALHPSEKASERSHPLVSHKSDSQHQSDRIPTKSIDRTLSFDRSAGMKSLTSGILAVVDRLQRTDYCRRCMKMLVDSTHPTTNYRYNFSIDSCKN